MTTYDFIVIGGGSAGSVVASRLSEDPSVQVLLLEAGPRDRHPFYHMPAGFAKMTKGIGSWGWDTVPQKHMQNKVFRYTQAKVIGGGSAINAQIYTRGNAKDYDDWRQMGCEGWSYDDVLPFFKKSEDFQGQDAPHHGKDGPLTVRRGPRPRDQSKHCNYPIAWGRSLRRLQAQVFCHRGTDTTPHRFCAQTGRRQLSAE